MWPEYFGNIILVNIYFLYLNQEWHIPSQDVLDLMSYTVTRHIVQEHNCIIIIYMIICAGLLCIVSKFSAFLHMQHDMTCSWCCII